VDLRGISPVPEVSRGIVEIERSVGMDSGNLDASVDEELSDCVDEGPSWDEIDALCEEDDMKTQSPPISSSLYCPKPEFQSDMNIPFLPQPIQTISPVLCQERDSKGYQISENSVEHLEKIESENQRNPILLQVRGIPTKVKNYAKNLPKHLPRRLTSVSPTEVIERYYKGFIEPFPDSAERHRRFKEEFKSHASGCTRVQNTDKSFSFKFKLDRWVHAIEELPRLPPIYDDRHMPPRTGPLPLEIIDSFELWRPIGLKNKNVWMHHAYPIELEKDQNYRNEEEDEEEDDDDDEIQEIETVGTHNSQSSDGQLRMPHNIAKVEVIAT
jgi:hypothetical protein